MATRPLLGLSVALSGGCGDPLNGVDYVGDPLFVADLDVRGLEAEGSGGGPEFLVLVAPAGGPEAVASGLVDVQTWEFRRPRALPARVLAELWDPLPPTTRVEVPHGEGGAVQLGVAQFVVFHDTAEDGRLTWDGSGVAWVDRTLARAPGHAMIYVDGIGEGRVSPIEAADVGWVINPEALVDGYNLARGVECGAEVALEVIPAEPILVVGPEAAAASWCLPLPL